MDINWDLIGLVIVYAYVVIILLISEKLLKNHPSFSRKFTHIMIGNFLFLLPLFATKEVMALFASLPFVIVTFLMSNYSPLKISNRLSSTGHGLGLFYYAISWTVLAYFFFDYPYIIAVGIAAMSYGDGFASLIGQKFGKHKYNVFGDTKSFEGSLAMFLVLIVMLFVCLGYYTFIIGYPLHILNLFVIVIISAVATIVEGISPKGLDNLTVCFVAVALYILFLFYFV